METDDPIFCSRVNHMQLKFMAYATTDDTLREAFNNLLKRSYESAWHELTYCNHQRMSFVNDFTKAKAQQFCLQNGIIDRTQHAEIRFMADGFELISDAVPFGVEPHPTVNIMFDEKESLH